MTVLSTRTTLVPLYSNLTPSETGLIKENLDSQGIQNLIANNGTTISVPQESVDTLKVQLQLKVFLIREASIIRFFSDKAGIGMTDNEFNVVKFDAMQSEIANLIKNIDGVTMLMS